MSTTDASSMPPSAIGGVRIAPVRRMVDAISEPVTRPGHPREDDLESIGTMRGGRYRITTLLGEGGMSVVYGAFDTVLEREVALKVLRVDAELDPALLLREARVLAAVQHPNVVAVFAVRTDAPNDGRSAAPFFVMERVRGQTLNCFVHTHPPDVRQAIALLAQAAAGIDAIHAASLMHGDVKPSNILVDVQGTVKIADLGLVPLLERMHAGEILGTPAYISPERATGVVPERALAARSDVYSFAVVAMELLTGRLPFASETSAGLLVEHAVSPPPKISEMSKLSAAFDAPFERALSKSPELRPASCGAFVAMLREASTGADARGQPLRILVVDDDDDQRSQLAETLAMSLRGAAIETASDGERALHALALWPAVAILDLSMPGLSGIALIERVRRLAPDTAIIVVTGHGSGPEWREARALGVRRFFVKPVELRELATAIRERATPG